jgi:hypothetical protein
MSRVANTEAPALNNAAVQNRGIHFIGPERYAALDTLQVVFFLIMQLTCKVGA